MTQINESGLLIELYQPGHRSRHLSALIQADKMMRCRECPLSADKPRICRE